MYTYKLSNVLFIQMLKITAWIFLILAGLEVFLFWNSAKSTDLNFYRFEQVLEKAGIGPIFLIANVLIIIVFAVTLISFYMGSKSMYSILSLPMKPVNQLISFIIPCILNIIILWCLQFALVMIFGKWLPSFFPKLIQGFEYMNNYTLLAVVRYKPISVIYPLGIFNLIKTITLIMTIPITVIFCVFTFITRRYYYFFIIFIFGFMYCLFYGLHYDVLSIICIVVFLVYQINQSFILIKRRSIL